MSADRVEEARRQRKDANEAAWEDAAPHLSGGVEYGNREAFDWGWDSCHDYTHDALIAAAEQRGREAERETLRPMLQQAEAVIRSLIRDAPLADELHAGWEHQP